MLVHHPQPRRRDRSGQRRFSAATRCHDQCSGSNLSPVELTGAQKSWVWTSQDSRDVSAYLDADAPDPDRIDLMVQLCTRIGMIMEDMSPLAIDTSSDGLRGGSLNFFAQLGRWPFSSPRRRRSLGNDGFAPVAIAHMVHSVRRKRTSAQRLRLRECEVLGPSPMLPHAETA